MEAYGWPLVDIVTRRSGVDNDGLACPMWGENTVEAMLAEYVLDAAESDTDRGDPEC